MVFAHPIPRRPGGFSRLTDRLLAVALLACILLPTRLGAQATPAVAAQTPSPAAAPATGNAAPTPTPYALDDPNDPNLSREERMRRHRARVQRMLEDGRRQRMGLPPLSTPTPVPTPPPLAGAPASTTATLNTAHVSTATAQTTHSGLLISTKARVPHATFFLSPASVTARSGEQFATYARLHNPDNLALDRLCIVLSWPARNLQPASIHQDKIAKRLAGKPSLRLDREAGTLTYEARLKTPLDALDIDLLTIVWEATQPAENFQILPYLPAAENSTATDTVTTAWYGRRNVTESPLGLYDALAGARVNVRAADDGGDVPAGVRIVTPSLEAMQSMLVGLPDQSHLRLPTLWISQPVGRLLAKGEWVMCEIGVNNPDQMAFDEVRLGLRFDPGTVTFSDSDKGNYISAGVNALDGPFHVLWPWDLHFVNRINNARGQVYYRMGVGQWREQPSGPLIRLFGQVQRETRGPLLSWIWDPGQPADDPTTGIYLLGENVYQRGQAVADPRRAITSTSGGYLPTDPKIETAPAELYRQPQVMQ